MRDRAIWPVVQIMLHRLHASDTVMAFMISALPTILTLVITPIVDYRSDRFRSHPLNAYFSSCEAGQA